MKNLHANGIGYVCIVGAIVTVGFVIRELKRIKDNDNCVQTDDVLEPDEETTETRKSDIEKSISNACKKVGKSVGTICLKISAKHPKIVKTLCKLGTKGKEKT